MHGAEKQRPIRRGMGGLPLCWVGPDLRAGRECADVEPARPEVGPYQQSKSRCRGTTVWAWLEPWSAAGFRRGWRC